MAPHKIPADVRDFVSRYLPTLEHLEVLMLLQRTAARFWSPPEVAGELRIADPTAADVLEGLASDNFLDIKISNDVLYRFNPATPALEGIAARSADFYSRERIAMMNLVVTGSLGPIRDFAEAFRLKKSKHDG